LTVGRPLDSSTGTLLWTAYALNGIFKSVAVVNGTVYIGSDLMYAFHLPTQ